ncbi:MAG: hypothetical protein BM557_07860 [Flavobacterium sp. MedPE-SWcel]|uniref:hypothetical protein n=1 Tax=uncultured Flavobacterium sp. TaxID=165435 RepID=UPI00090EF39B|nr:hypothetical protein [uncultured Flavobacterium sp.]OIQ18120.1 MAG: hypothetical protein BM557_07860 [Flavobacterium sp. MedPE-SWcel]
MKPVTKITILLFFILIIIGCNNTNKGSYKPPFYESDSLRIVYYKLNSSERYSETIMLSKEELKNCINYTYSYKNLQESNDSISFYKDSIVLNNRKINFLQDKTYLNGTRETLLRKYEVDYIYNSLNLFFNEKNKLVMSRSISANIVVEYYNKSDPSNIHSLILKDSTFFEPEW